MARREDSYALAAQSLRVLDRDRYFATLVIPGRARKFVQAVYAYAAELAAIRERAREPGPGEIRLKWWIDALSGTEHGEVRANPVADALLDAIERFGLSSAPFVRMAEARRFDLYDEPMPNLTQLEGYAGETVSVAYQTAAIIANGGADPGSADAAGHLGVGEALTRSLFAMPADLARGRIRVPLSVFRATGLDEAALLSGRATPGLVAAAAQLREVARGHLGRARAELKRLPRSVRPVFAPIVLSEWLLARLEEGGADPLRPVRAPADWHKLAGVVGFALRA